jgi:hypothetical protein
MKRVGAVLVCSLGIACGAAGADTDTSEDDLSAEPRIALLVEGEAARISCREVGQHFACGSASARAMADACARGAPYKLQTVQGACRKNERLYPTVSSCNVPIPGTCAFYAGCLERAVPCGEPGYALGFGEKFCTSFRSTALSEAGEAWKANTMVCLQRALVPRVVATSAFSTMPASKSTCDAVSADAFASHARCYTEEQNSICALPGSDLVEISATIGFRELVRARTSDQVLSVAGVCVRRLVSHIFTFGSGSNIAPGAVPRGTDDETSRALSFWQELAAD